MRLVASSNTPTQIDCTGPDLLDHAKTAMVPEPDASMPIPKQETRRPMKHKACQRTMVRSLDHGFGQPIDTLPVAFLVWKSPTSFCPDSCPDRLIHSDIGILESICHQIIVLLVDVAMLDVGAHLFKG